MKTPRHSGRDVNSPDRPELDHFELCPVCGQLFDLRDLSQVRAHLHEPDFDIEPARPN
jgi:hypothetical protein